VANITENENIKTDDDESGEKVVCEIMLEKS